MNQIEPEYQRIIDSCPKLKQFIMNYIPAWREANKIYNYFVKNNIFKNLEITKPNIDGYCFKISNGDYGISITTVRFSSDYPGIKTFGGTYETALIYKNELIYNDYLDYDDVQIFETLEELIIEIKRVLKLWKEPTISEYYNFKYIDNMIVNVEDNGNITYLEEHKYMKNAIIIQKWWRRLLKNPHHPIGYQRIARLAVY